jgi:pepF/M3 family oligoendopeptidase
MTPQAPNATKNKAWLWRRNWRGCDPRIKQKEDGMSAERTRSDALPHWDLTNVYPGLESPAFSQAVNSLETRLDDLDRYMQLHGIGVDGPSLAEAGKLAKVIGDCLDQINDIQKRYRTLQAYVHSFVTTDSYNTRAKRLYSELEGLGVRSHQQRVRFQAWVGTFAGRLGQILPYETVVLEHSFYLHELAEQSRFLMSDSEESLAAELSLSGANAWQRLQGTVTSQLTVSFERNGRQEVLPITALQNLARDPDADVRRRAFETELAVWESVREPLAAALNGVKGYVITLNKKRGRADALHSALDQSRIDRETLETMLEVMQNSFPAFRRYLKAKAARLERDALPWWDLFAPVGRTDRRFSFAEARDFIVTQFGTFSDRLAIYAERAFDANWIDAEPRDGKRGGAFCMRVPAVEESRILCNFDGSLDQVFTLAHELGHGYHNHCQTGKTMLQRITPMTLAETASIFCETIVTDALLETAYTPDEELAILETFLIGATQIIVDITSRFLFETEVFERREKAELSAQDFCDLMLGCQKETYGDGLDASYLHPYMWAWKPHYYRPTLSFYNFPYAFGLLFGLGLYAIHKERGAAFTAEYDALLASTGEATPADLASRFGIDIRRPAFWRDSVRQIEARIERYLEL